LNLLAETAGGTTTYHLFGPGIDEPLATSRAASVIYHSTDGLGSVALGTDAAGSQQNSYTYDAWGVSRSSTENISQPFRYTAREQGDTGDQLFYRARFLAPAIARFPSEDPVRFASSSYYSYVGNNPIAYIDPSGKQAAQVLTIGVAVITTAIIGVTLYQYVRQNPQLWDFPRPPAPTAPWTYPPTPSSFGPRGRPIQPGRGEPRPGERYHEPLPQSCDFPTLPGNTVEPPRPEDPCQPFLDAASRASGTQRIIYLAAYVWCRANS
jgi:RHS repeat-associated protein